MEGVNRVTQLQLRGPQHLNVASERYDTFPFIGQGHLVQQLERFCKCCVFYITVTKS